jgi:hypothetical protein
VQQKQILEDLGLLIVKNHLLLQFVKSSYLKRFSMHLCLEEFYFCKQKNSYELLLKLVEKTKCNYMFY